MMYFASSGCGGINRFSSLDSSAALKKLPLYKDQSPDDGHNHCKADHDDDIEHLNVPQ